MSKSLFDVLVTCPPMIQQIDSFKEAASNNGLKLHAADTKQTLSESELIDLLPNFDGWIIGDDHTSYEVLSNAKKGKLKAAIKWGVGTDNIDFDAFKKLEIPVTNTPNMFGDEVAELAMLFILGLSRDAFYTDRRIRDYDWPKPTGFSLRDKTIGILGLGDIGLSLAKKIKSFDVNIIGYDPYYKPSSNIDLVHLDFPKKIESLDFLVITCSLNETNHHIINKDILAKMKNTSSLVNVSRGGLIDYRSLENALKSKSIHSAALDVFDIEPLPRESLLREFDQCIFSSHNASNTYEGVIRASNLAIDLLSKQLKK